MIQPARIGQLGNGRGAPYPEYEYISYSADDRYVLATQDIGGYLGDYIWEVAHADLPRPDDSEDGYELRSSGGGVGGGCRPHASEYIGAPDGIISFSEALRRIQLNNAAGIDACDGGEDGFCLD